MGPAMRKPTAGHLYVLELSDGLVKVGFAGFPDGRIAQHKHGLSKKGVQIARSWVSPKHLEAYLNEELLIAACAGLGAEARFGKEWFSGLRFEDAVAAARSIGHTPSSGDAARSMITSDEARRKIRGLLDEIQADPEAAVRVSRHGRPVAVVVSAVWYERAVMNGKDGEQR